jgi:AraC-like DNA-binding protein
MSHGFHLSTTDPEEFQDRISPLSGSCRVRPAKGSEFEIRVRAAKLGKLGLFVVKAPSISVLTPPPHDYFGVNIPLGKPFTVTESSRCHRFRDDAHLVTPDRSMNLEAPVDCRVLALKLTSEQVLDCAFKLSGAQSPFEPAECCRLQHATTAFRALVRGIAGLWSDLQREDAPPASPIDIAEREDAIFTCFVLAAQGEAKTGNWSAEQVEKSTLARAEEYLRARLTQPVSRADLAVVTGVSIRTLSRGFAKRWGTGPMGVLRKLRMEAAYRELLGAESRATSVTEVACRYGFTHLGKFAGEYKRAFHESPSETLRH